MRPLYPEEMPRVNVRQESRLKLLILCCWYLCQFQGLGIQFLELFITCLSCKNISLLGQVNQRKNLLTGIRQSEQCLSLLIIRLPGDNWPLYCQCQCPKSHLLVATFAHQIDSHTLHIATPPVCLPLPWETVLALATPIKQVHLVPMFFITKLQFKVCFLQLYGVISETHANLGTRGGAMQSGHQELDMQFLSRNIISRKSFSGPKQSTDGEHLRVLHTQLSCLLLFPQSGIAVGNKHNSSYPSIPVVPLPECLWQQVNALPEVTTANDRDPEDSIRKSQSSKVQIRILSYSHRIMGDQLQKNP